MDRDRRKVKRSLFKLRLCSLNTFDELFKMEMSRKSEEMKERVVWSRSVTPTFLDAHNPVKKVDVLCFGVALMMLFAQFWISRFFFWFLLLLLFLYVTAPIGLS